MLTLVRKAVSFELGMWRSLYRWILRRPPATGTVFGYAGAVTPIFGVFIGMSIVEVPILHLILPWPTVRFISLMLGAYGVFWMVGLLASMRVNPHLVDDSGLRIRYGLSVDLTVPWDHIAAIRKRYNTLPMGRTVRVEDGALHVAVSNQTSVDVVLREPTVFAPSKGEHVREVRIHADDPDALVRRVRQMVILP